CARPEPERGRAEPLPAAQRTDARGAVVHRRFGLHADLRAAAHREPRARRAVPVRRLHRLHDRDDDGQFRARPARIDGGRRRDGRRARRGPAALRARLRAAPGVAHARRRLRAQRSRAGDLGRRHLHRAGAGVPARRVALRLDLLSEIPAVRARARHRRVHRAVAAAASHAARRADPRRRRRRRDGRGDGRQHPARVPRHLHAGLRAGRTRRHDRRRVPDAVSDRGRRDPRVLARRRDHRRLGQPGRCGGRVAARRAAERGGAGDVPRARVFRDLRSDGGDPRVPPARPVREGGMTATTTTGAAAASPAGAASQRSALAWGAGIAAFFAVLPVVLRSYQVSVATEVLIFALLAMSIDVLAGYAGRTSLGHGALFGASTYVVLYWTAVLGGSPWAGLAIGIVAATVLSAVFALFCTRVSGVYFLL